jgi:hypothetical protein
MVCKLLECCFCGENVRRLNKSDGRGKPEGEGGLSAH